MSSDNGLMIVKRPRKGYRLYEYNASGGNCFWSENFDTLEEAVRAAHEYMREEEVEYGVRFLNI